MISCTFERNLIELLNTVKKNRVNNYLLLLVAATYLFIAVSHIFYLPQLISGNPSAPVISNSIFKRHNAFVVKHDTTYLQRADKSTVDERKKALSDVSQYASVAFLILFVCLAPLYLQRKTFPRNYLFYNRQFSYLALCTFRI